MSIKNNHELEAARSTVPAELPKLDLFMGGGVGDTSALTAIEEMSKTDTKPVNLGFTPVAMYNGPQICAN